MKPTRKTAPVTATTNRDSPKIYLARVDAPKNAGANEKISDGSNSFGRSDIVHYLLQNVVARRQGATHDLQHTATVQLLEHFVRRQHGFSVLFGSLLQSRAQLGARVARRNFQRNRLSH